MSQSLVPIILSLLSYFIGALLWKEAVRSRRELNLAQERRARAVLQSGCSSHEIDFEKVDSISLHNQAQKSDQMALLSALFIILGFLPLMICISQLLKVMGVLN